MSAEWNRYEPELRKAPQSYRIRSFLCDGCNHVHIVLFTEDDHVIAHATISDEILLGITKLNKIAASRTS